MSDKSFDKALDFPFVSAFFVAHIVFIEMVTFGCCFCQGTCEHKQEKPGGHEEPQRVSDKVWQILFSLLLFHEPIHKANICPCSQKTGGGGDGGDGDAPDFPDMKKYLS